jgi:cell fate (sporulation/competence/biofilm development) regulator YlbF (YheA/YmcA/DUF963 family)
MKIYALARYSRVQLAAGVGYRYTWPYRTFFHRDHDPPVINRYGERPYKSLHLVRNVRLMPPVFITGVHIVLAEHLAGRLGVFNHVDLNPCVWENVYDYPVDEQHIVDLYNRFSALTEDFGEWLKERMHPPGPGLTGIKYLEMIVPVIQDVAQEFDCRTKLELPDFDEDESPVMTCAELHGRYAIVKVDSYYLCTEPAYRLLKPYVNDPAMFSLYTIEVDAAGVPAHAAVTELHPAGPLTPEPLSNMSDALGPRTIPPPDARQEFFNRILEESAKLAEVAAQHPDVLECRAAHVAVAQDAEAQHVWCEVQAALDEFYGRERAEVPLTKERQAEIDATLRRALQNPKVDRLWDARTKLSDLMQQIYDAVQRRLDPQVTAPGEQCRDGGA